MFPYELRLFVLLDHQTDRYKDYLQYHLLPKPKIPNSYSLNLVLVHFEQNLHRGYLLFPK